MRPARHESCIEVALRQDASISSKFLGNLDVGRRCKAYFAARTVREFRAGAATPSCVGGPSLCPKAGRSVAGTGHGRSRSPRPGRSRMSRWHGGPQHSPTVSRVCVEWRLDHARQQQGRASPCAQRRGTLQSQALSDKCASSLRSKGF